MCLSNYEKIFFSVASWINHTADTIIRQPTDSKCNGKELKKILVNKFFDVVLNICIIKV